MKTPPPPQLDQCFLSPEINFFRILSTMQCASWQEKTHGIYDNARPHSSTRVHIKQTKSQHITTLLI